MRRALQLALVIVLIGAATSYSGEVIDRIAAVVNRGVILESDVDVAVRTEAFLDDRPLASIRPEDYSKTLDRLIDQEVLRQEMGDTIAVTDQQVRTRIAEIRSQIAEGRTDTEWQERLNRCGLTPSDLEERVRVQLELWRFVELRLRPNVRVDDSSIESYYREEFIPELRRAGAKDVPLSEVSARIRQILVERSLDQMLRAWLHNLRDQSDIHTELDHHAPAHQGEVPAPGRVAASKAE